jgi:DNA processing protein
VLFTLGDPSAIGPVRAAIVGTRRCTRYGVDLAYELGALLATNGVTVVSGLAKGIDAAAHTGALDASGAAPVAVVGSGLDCPYPAQNRALWGRVANAGLVCGEAPIGASPERWRFPARNRIIAGLAQIVIVVESHVSGGSLYTAAQAIERGRPVLAVPGPIRSRASLGCNRLLADGCHPLCEPSDALIALGMAQVTVAAPAPHEVSAMELDLLEAMGWLPATLDQLLAAGAGSLQSLALALEVLEARGLVDQRGPWYERTALSAFARRPNGPQDATPGACRPRRVP